MLKNLENKLNSLLVIHKNECNESMLIKRKSEADDRHLSSRFFYSACFNRNKIHSDTHSLNDTTTSELPKSTQNRFTFFIKSTDFVSFNSKILDFTITTFSNTPLLSIHKFLTNNRTIIVKTDSFINFNMAIKQHLD